jgi:hypothetical protein
MLHWLAEELMPEASVLASKGFNAKKKEDALEPTKKAFKAYAQCEQVVTRVVREEPALARYAVPTPRGKKTATWLRQHCTKSRVSTGQLLSRITGKAPPRPPKMKPKPPPRKPPPKKPPPKKPPPKKEAKPPPASEAEKTEEKAEEKASKKKKKRKKKRRGRIRRW